jgi:hypothetical protein
VLKHLSLKLANQFHTPGLRDRRFEWNQNDSTARLIPFWRRAFSTKATALQVTAQSWNALFRLSDHHLPCVLIQSFQVWAAPFSGLAKILQFALGKLDSDVKLNCAPNKKSADCAFKEA